MSQPPVEMYEALFELNLKGLLEAINKRDFDRMHGTFNRLTHALEQVESLKLEQARRETRILRHLSDGTPFLGDN